MKQKLTQISVRAMSPGDQTAAYFQDAVIEGKRGPGMSLQAQQKFHNDAAGAVNSWIESLPRR